MAELIRPVPGGSVRRHDELQITVWVGVDKWLGHCMLRFAKGMPDEIAANPDFKYPLSDRVYAAADIANRRESRTAPLGEVALTGPQIEWLQQQVSATYDNNVLAAKVNESNFLTLLAAALEAATTPPNEV